jgi:hypothetical protein
MSLLNNHRMKPLAGALALIFFAPSKGGSLFSENPGSLFGRNQQPKDGIL